jgi:hypothetical protein
VTLAIWDPVIRDNLDITELEADPAAVTSASGRVSHSRPNRPNTQIQSQTALKHNRLNIAQTSPNEASQHRCSVRVASQATPGTVPVMSCCAALRYPSARRVKPAFG